MNRSRSRIRTGSTRATSSSLDTRRTASGGSRVARARPRGCRRPVARRRRSTPRRSRAIPPGDIEPYLTRPLDHRARGPRTSAARDRRRTRRSASSAARATSSTSSGIDPEGRRPLVHLPAGRDAHVARQSGRGPGLRAALPRHARKVERFARRRRRCASSTSQRGDPHRRPPGPGAARSAHQLRAACAGPARSTAGSSRSNRDATEAGRGWIVTIDKGAADGVDVGTVLAIYRVRAADPRSAPARRALARSGAVSTDDRSTAGALPQRARRAHRPAVRVPRLRSRVLRARCSTRPTRSTSATTSASRSPARRRAARRGARARRR